MDRRKIFDKVRGHLLVQKAKAWNKRLATCEYISSDGLKCAIGCLIPDGHPALKSRDGVTNLMKEFPDLKSLWGVTKDGDINFLSSLQRVHDSWQPGEWEIALTLVEQGYDV